MAFCGRCGTRLAAQCPSCGFTNPEGFAFCGKCGARVEEGTAPPRQSAPAFASPQSYTPKHLAEKILTSKAALEGERKQVTVLFADLKGSMELLADRDPEEARNLLDPVLERMMEAVHHYEGTVNQVMGDGIMALFGAPIGHEDHAVRGCYAAVRMQRRVALYADEIQRAGGTPVQIRVGLNSGEVVVRAIGSDLRMDYTAVGQTTHLAARMEQMAKPGSTLVTGDTLRLAEGYVQVRSLGAVTLKGIDTPTPVYELIGIVPARSRFQASAVRGLTRFVGRDTEMQQLTQALEHAGAGHGQAVAVVGEAGVGKSRLVWEFTQSHRTHGWLVLQSGSVSYGKATPYLPVIDLLKAYCRIQERNDPRAIRERVAGKLLTLDRALEPLLTPLLALLDVPVDDAVWDALEPPLRRQRTLEAVKRLLLRESQVQPLLLIFEDLHWIDTETQALLDGLMESLPTARVLVLVNYRPEYQHAWGSKTYYTQLRIDPLPPESAEALLHVLLGTDQTLEPLTRVLIARTEGNPFFLEESVQALVETQVLVGQRGAYRLGNTPETWQIPATAQAILAARIDRLAPEEKRLLQTASVIGKDVPFALLRAIADASDDDLRRGLAHLQRAEFLYETSLFPDLEYTFKHALTHEVAYGGLLTDRRRAIHARIVEAIEALYPERLTEQVERLAHHVFRGELWEKAVTYLRQAGGKAASRSLHRDAVAYLEQALAALDHLPERRERVTEAIDLRLDLRNSLHPLAEHERIVEYLAGAEKLAVGLADPLRQARVLGYLSMHFGVVGPPARALEHAERALALASQAGSTDLELEMRLRAGIAYTYVDQRQTITILRELISGLDDDLAARHRFGLMFTAPGARGILAQSLAAIGDFHEAAAVGAEAVLIAEALDHRYSLAFVCRVVGTVHALRGDLARALPLLTRSLELCRTVGARFLLPGTAAQLGLARTHEGRTVDAGVLLDEAVDEAPGDYETVWTKVVVAAGYQRIGRLERAAEVAEVALAQARERGEAANAAWASYVLGEAAAASNPPGAATAERHYQAVLSAAESLGLRPLVAHCHLGLGTLHRRTGDDAKAQEHLTTATVMYREMGMTFWLEKAVGELGGVER
jgi:class 3 adenylate cyclase/tetratricopeptide (TPR) repeat protein